MRINKIEFENFRNFKDHGEIYCSQDNKTTIIYGRNGDGKTTLHQLLRWVFYDVVNFNKTATAKLYNLPFEKGLKLGEVFEVMGRIEFSHNGVDYEATRRYTYQKGIIDSELKHRDFSLLYKNSDNDWKMVEEPAEVVIEKLLPAALSEYFFFDGESMIADLRVKEKESAAKLKRALFSMFDLDSLENAIAHIGDTSKKTSVLGKLYLKKNTSVNSNEVKSVKVNIENAQSKLEKLYKNQEKYEKERTEKLDIIKEISEEIGTKKSKAEYEKERKNLKDSRDIFLKNSSSLKADFGDMIIDVFPQRLISKSIEVAKERIHLEISKNSLPPGITKALIKHLISDEVTKCICGHEMSQEEKVYIEDYLKLMPPNSYAEMYNELTAKANAWGYEYNKEKFDELIMRVINNDEQAHNCDSKISILDEAEKNSSDIETLIINRQNAEKRIIELNDKLTQIETEIKNGKRYLNQRMKEFDKLTADNKNNEEINHKIHIMQKVLEHFIKLKDEATIEYSSLLNNNIQELLDKMLTSDRQVTVSSEFSVKVTDSTGDESKSEGQFAVVSFAYIGGILKMLKDKANLSKKEYPLVLDGPFSKLDPIQRQNVVDTLPEFAPQVILFSKDELQDVFNEENIGRIWTIVSNDEKNIAEIKEGYLWK